MSSSHENKSPYYVEMSYVDIMRKSHKNKITQKQIMLTS